MLIHTDRYLSLRPDLNMDQQWNPMGGFQPQQHQQPQQHNTANQTAWQADQESAIARVQVSR